MSDLNVWLIRHGQSSANAGTWSRDPRQTLLTPAGLQQAQQVAAAIPCKADLLVMSPLRRAQQSAEPILARWPDMSHAIWPIQELTCLSPQKLALCPPEERVKRIHDYWLNADPYYEDGEDAESFRQFQERICAFFHGLRSLSGFVIVVGHGQFFNACQLTLTQGISTSPEWMTMFRQREIKTPMHNSEIYRLKLTAEQLAVKLK
ncbi:histidine phosphatase family protein [Legionella sp. CNM-4043-24]|uniref:histidine phosphatase family protein n=1 Tax=Legionella sp. CNM-4043-24 TaxID=3421646 RepID=UPI00403ABE3B